LNNDKLKKKRRRRWRGHMPIRQRPPVWETRWWWLAENPKCDLIAKFRPTQQSLSVSLSIHIKTPIQFYNFHYSFLVLSAINSVLHKERHEDQDQAEKNNRAKCQTGVQCLWLWCCLFC
jgi:hypothetical protein